MDRQTRIEIMLAIGMSAAPAAIATLVMLPRARISQTASLRSVRLSLRRRISSDSSNRPPALSGVR
jgi:hypothetical protein